MRSSARPVLSALLSGGTAARALHPDALAAARLQRRRHRPGGTTTREAYDLLAEGFGPGFNGPFAMVAALPSKGEDAGARELRKDPRRTKKGSPRPPPVTLNPAEEHRRLPALPDHLAAERGDDRAARPHPRRRDPADRAADRRPGPRRRHHRDLRGLRHAISEKLPLFIGVVVLLSALLLMIVFRSILVPLKAIVMNLLSIGAAFGLIVAVFQWGWGASLIGVDGTGPIISFFPIFLFSIVFGLSMDYEVFLMSRIHEEWEHSHDATVAVTRGLALTGRVITAAAAIMVTVFASFMIGEDRIIKLFGLGLASAVFIDAVIIRSVLVPAIMQLFGKSAWWLPAWLDRILPRLHVSPPRAIRRRPASTRGRRAPELRKAGREWCPLRELMSHAACALSDGWSAATPRR